MKGQRPTVRVQHRFEWLYLWAFVNPESGQSLWYILPRVGVEAYNLILADFAKSLAASPDKHILLVQDRAGWHTSKRLALPTGIEPVYLPPYSPELGPAERLWRLSDAPLFNRSFRSLADLQAQLEPRCIQLMSQPDLISKETLFYW